MAKLGQNLLENPIIRGFNPDPSICRAGDRYFIATSTFEWYPGVQFFSSSNLRDWTFVGRPLAERRLLDLTGVPDSCGVWAPCLTFADNLFWLCYTNVRRFSGDFKDTPNFLTTSLSIDGPWSDPIYLNSSGFDPSLFHDSDGRKWLVNMVWDHRPDRSHFGGIVMQEYSVDQEVLIGPRRMIFPGSAHDGTEGPHLFAHDGYYFLICAEGGTGYQHAITVARAKQIEGPYVLPERTHLITAKDDPDHPLQRSGHGDIVKTPDGRFFTTYLCSRPLPGGRSPMGRESGIQEIFYRDGWFHPDSGYDDVRPSITPFCDPAASVPVEVRYEFDGPALPHDFQWLRLPDTSELFSTTAAKGRLRLYGRESVGSTFNQALVARRQTEHRYCAETTMEFAPDCFQQAAGLITYYNAHKFHYCYVSFDPEFGRYAGIMSCAADLTTAVSFPDWKSKIPVYDGKIRIRVEVDGAKQQFFIASGPSAFEAVGPTLDSSLLSDEAGAGEGVNFTGNFVGMAVQDLTGQRRPADFLDFYYATQAAGKP